MRTSRKLLATASALLVLLGADAATVHAQTQSKTTKYVLRACERVGSSDERLSTLSTAVCVYQVSGFLDGYLHGVGRGVRTTLIHDEKASRTVGGIDDLQARASAARSKARCLPDDYDIDEVINVWSTYVKLSQTNLDDEPYGSTLQDALELYYCSE